MKCTDAVLIHLTQGMLAIVDKSDWPRVRRHKWRVSRSSGKGRKLGEPYAATTIKGRKVYLHRFLTGEPGGMIVHHVNNQTLDYRRCNLEVTTVEDNRRKQIYRRKKYRSK